MSGLMLGTVTKFDGQKWTDINDQPIVCDQCGRPATSLMRTNPDLTGGVSQEMNRCWLHGPAGLDSILVQQTADLKELGQEIARELKSRYVAETARFLEDRDGVG